jgi:catechol 2,3-dioxygenase-like lactoylglutathione lyase family enzyme
MNKHAVRMSGAHHVRIPVSDLGAAIRWFADVLGYEKEFPFKLDGVIDGWALQHENGGPSLAVMTDPVRANACRGFPLLAFGVPDEATVGHIAARLDKRGIAHGGVQPALFKVKLPFVEGPDGILFGFYVKEGEASPAHERVRDASGPP